MSKTQQNEPCACPCEQSAHVFYMRDKPMENLSETEVFQDCDSDHEKDLSNIANNLSNPQDFHEALKEMVHTAQQLLCEIDSSVKPRSKRKETKPKNFCESQRQVRTANSINLEIHLQIPRAGMGNMKYQVTANNSYNEHPAMGVKMGQIEFNTQNDYFCEENEETISTGVEPKSCPGTCGMQPAGEKSLVYYNITPSKKPYKPCSLLYTPKTSNHVLHKTQHNNIYNFKSNITDSSFPVRKSSSKNSINSFPIRQMSNAYGSNAIHSDNKSVSVAENPILAVGEKMLFQGKRFLIALATYMGGYADIELDENQPHDREYVHDPHQFHEVTHQESTNYVLNEAGQSSMLADWTQQLQQEQEQLRPYQEQQHLHPHQQQQLQPFHQQQRHQYQPQQQQQSPIVFLFPIPEQNQNDSPDQLYRSQPPPYVSIDTRNPVQQYPEYYSGAGNYLPYNEPNVLIEQVENANKFTSKALPTCHDQCPMRKLQPESSESAENGGSEETLVPAKDEIEKNTCCARNENKDNVLCHNLTSEQCILPIKKEKGLPTEIVNCACGEKLDYEVFPDCTCKANGELDENCQLPLCIQEAGVCNCNCSNLTERNKNLMHCCNLAIDSDCFCMNYFKPKAYKLALPQHRDIKVCIGCRFEPSPLINEKGEVFCPGNCGCCLCPWQRRQSTSKQKIQLHDKLKVCKCRERGTIFNITTRESRCSNVMTFDLCPCREVAEAKFLELYNKEMSSLNEVELDELRGEPVFLKDVIELRAPLKHKQKSARKTNYSAFSHYK